MKLFQKTIAYRYCLVFILCLIISNLNGQCDQNYDWAVWNNFSGTSATGTITQGGQTINMEVTANYNFNSTPSIFNYGAFNGFNSNIPNSTVPQTEWTAGVGGETTMCFSEVVTNPVLLLASIGAPWTEVYLELSLPYIPIYDGGGMTFVNDTTILGVEGFTILLFPGEFQCITIYSTTPEYYTNFTWGLNPPLFPIDIIGDTVTCNNTTLVASGGSTYLWSGGITPNSAVNTFYETGNYFLTVTDAIGCEVVTSVSVEIDSTICIDCAGTLFGTAVIDECGECLEPTDPNFNQSCSDCAGIPNGTSVIDECGDCFEPTNPNFNQSCADCAGTPNGTAVIDDCGECLEPTDPNFNMICIDCAGLMNGTAILDECGVCLEPTDPNFNQSCADCTGTPNGTAVIDDCGECNEPSNPNFNQSCTDCTGTLNGTAVIDDCGECLELTDPSFNQSCTDCTGTINGSATIDYCGVCNEPNSPLFNQSCADQNRVYIPNAFSPNDDGFNDFFQVYAANGIVKEIKKYFIFDRWGEQVYGQENFTLDASTKWWNGDFNGKKLQMGVFVYYIEVEYFFGENIKYQGDISLVK